MWIEIKNSYNVKDAGFNKKIKYFKDQYPKECITIIIGHSKNKVNTWKSIQQKDLVDILAELKTFGCNKL
jgi:hypothetical protein